MGTQVNLDRQLAMVRPDRGDALFLQTDIWLAIKIMAIEILISRPVCTLLGPIVLSVSRAEQALEDKMRLAINCARPET